MRETPPVVEDQVGVLEALVRRAQLIWRLLLDERVNLGLKLIPLAALLYVLFPIDILPDLLPPLGQIDDIAAIILGLNLFVEMVPPDIVREHQRELAARPAAQLKDEGESNER